MNHENIKIKNVSYKYSKKEVLKDISFDIENSKITTIIGSNGAGKSTLLKCCNNILHHETGNIIVYGRDITKMSSPEIAKKIGYVPQKYFSSVKSTVFESVLIGIHRKSLFGYTDEEMDKVEKILEQMELADISEDQVSNLSGGQQQKVAIARSLVDTPPFVFLDEPTSGLDLRSQRDLMKFLRELSRKSGIGILTILHDINLASEFSDTIIMLKSGSLYANGTPDEVISKDNIKEVFNLDVVIMTHNDVPFIMPI